jgi:hypothetical protein
MIPSFNHSNVLPPFVGDRLTAAKSSPYLLSASELVSELGQTAARRNLLLSFFKYRRGLRKFGFMGGFQWLNGSFSENIELEKNRPPSDIDLVTFTHAVTGLSAEQINVNMNNHPELFDRDICRATFNCDVFIVNLSKQPELLVQDVRYWYGLFSHRRGDHIWKGFLQIPLDSDDEAAVTELEQISKTEMS